MQNLLAQVEIGQSVSWGNGSLESKFPDIASLINMLLQNIFIFAGIVFIGMIILGGYKMLTSAGQDPKLFAQARDILKNGIIGLCIIFAAFLIVQAVQVLTGVIILNPNL